MVVTRLEVLLGQGDVRDRRVVGVEGDRYADPVEPGERMVGHGRARSRPASCEVGHRSSVTRRAMSSAHRSGSSTAPGPCAIRSGSISSARRTWAAPPHSPAWMVTRRPPSRAAANDAAWIGGSGNACSGPARSQPDEALVAEPRGGLGERQVGIGLVRAKRRADQPDRRPGPVGRVLRTTADGRDPVGQRQPARQVEKRSPADLDVAHAVGRLGLDQLAGDPLERVGVLDAVRSAGRTPAAARPATRTASAR